MAKNIISWIKEKGIVLGDGGYLIELERRGYVDSGSEREKVGTGRGSGQFTPEVAIEHPEAFVTTPGVSEGRFPGVAGTYVLCDSGEANAVRVRTTDRGH
jgi:hypothetical protein